MSAIDFSDPATIAFLTEALTAAGVNGLEISQPGGQLRIVVAGKGGARISSTEATPRAPGLAPGSASAVVKAPMAGRFCVEHPASATPQKLPRSVSDADIVGFVGVGHILLPLRAGRSGILTRLIAEPGALVGFGDPLFEIELQS
ncbi:acetyl-CoA carboxylase biotin carboxyl carrier protein [Rhizobium leguminosarum]|uniref:acetyl-CoA carboxylase biotin carboxyl carrier protein n=1 Tax=Rhizobium leguminosarum TaxID=384 RepID=UPI0004063F0E|nr:acetyl-CoA carboxylase [Rhizobium leguminosarum]MBY5323377.1 acetyl-CoA carboxylase [Rhizobium leguminosarum]MBY5384571.1 acetyl-CoA carboxylase [Rhizobium leguminosarum]MCA2434934.1 acetyl-CoA carboxylase [Rhizobium leguminosarum]NEH45956.1 acetyl-CoA carboxylase [Rhizobium leguminosarum]NEH70798.1 acetyl-CoA carboxylase [Rhizobium leguminosarum]